MGISTQPYADDLPIPIITWRHRLPLKADMRIVLGDRRGRRMRALELDV